MSGRLNTFVHVVELDADGKATGQAAVFGPDDDLPDWAVAAITNPDVWAEAPELQQDSELPPPGSGDPDVPPPPPSPKAPPRGGAGSGRDAWVAYADASGVEVTDDLRTREDIIAACELAGVPVE